MLVVPDGEGAVLCVGQASHGWLAGQLARAWGTDRFPRPEPWEEVCLGAEQHDVGMAGWDLAPELDPDTGFPRAFTALPAGTHLRLWAQAPDRLLTQSRYAALLCSLHGVGLQRLRDRARLGDRERGLLDDLLEGERRRQDRLAADLRADHPDDPAYAADAIERNRRLVWAWDGLALALPLGWDPHTVEDVPDAAGAATPLTLRRVAGEGGATHTVDPWPFADERVEGRVEGRRLEAPSASDAELHAALEAAPWRTLRFALVPTREG